LRLSRSWNSNGSASGIPRISFATIARRATPAKIVADTSVLIKWFKTAGEDLLKEARALLAEVHLETLPFVVAPPATPLLKRAARLGREFGLTFYDASFIALSVELNYPYITADRRLYDRARTLPRVRHLSRVGSLS